MTPTERPSPAGNEPETAPKQRMARRIGAFAGIPLFSSLAPFLLLPYISRVGGAQTWVALGVGQAAGSLAAIVITLGWTLSGPAQVASEGESSIRRRLYVLSLLTRSSFFLLSIPILALVSFLIVAPESVPITLFMALAQAAAGLSPSWYCIAIGSAKKIFLYDALPRLLAIVLCVPFLLLTNELLLYPLAILIGGLLGTICFTARHTVRKDFTGIRVKDIARSIWDMRGASSTTIAAGFYATTPVLVVGAVGSVLGSAIFVSADKLYRVGLLAVGALGNSFQGWVAEIGADRKHRMRFSLLAHSCLGLLGFLGFTFLGPFVTKILFGEVVAADAGTCFWFGISFLLVSINTSTGSHILVPLHKIRIVFWSTVIGAIIGLPSMIILSRIYDGLGGALGLAIGEFVVTAIQLIALISIRTERFNTSR